MNRTPPNPADRLIVALDTPIDDAFDLAHKLQYQANFFKIGVGTFLLPHGRDLATFLVREGAGLMLDLKLYDTRDTVKRTMESAAKLGANMVTVHADCLEHATGFGPKVLVVRRLTDGTGRGEFSLLDDMLSDGFVCSVETAGHIRHRTDKLIVCPGIRMSNDPSDNHLRPATPRRAIEAGADYIIVGRPIYTAPDPVEAARAITREIAAAITQGAQP